MEKYLSNVINVKKINEFVKWIRNVMNITNGTSGNDFIDKFIQESQMNAQNADQILEWIPYNRFKNIEYFDKGGFSIIYKAIWLDGPIKYWSKNKKNGLESMKKQ